MNNHFYFKIFTPDKRGIIIIILKQTGEQRTIRVLVRLLVWAGLDTRLLLFFLILTLYLEPEMWCCWCPPPLASPWSPDTPTAGGGAVAGCSNLEKKMINS